MTSPQVERGAAGGALKVAGTIISILMASWPHSAPACPPQPRLTPLATPRVGALERPFDLAKGRERRVEGRSGDGVARAGSASPQVPVGKPRGRVGVTFGATPVPGAPTPTGCPTLTTSFFKENTTTQVCECAGSGSPGQPCICFHRCAAPAAIEGPHPSPVVRRLPATGQVCCILNIPLHFK